MFGDFFTFILVNISMLLFFSSSFAMIGPGLYNVLDIRKCDENEDNYLFTCDVTRRKYNRTHDGFNTTITLKHIFDHSYSIFMEICKHVDGGCKLYNVMRDQDIIHFMMEYAEENVRHFLELAGIHPPDFPLPAGTITANNFIYDYKELPNYSPYGTFEARSVALDRNGAVVGCIHMAVEFAKQEDDDEDFKLIP